jgi:TetR/AcrR family transcriptional regulator
MARTTRRAAPEPRARILTAALAAFAARGVGASSIQDVADAAGMSKQALLHHFRTKERLREGVYELLAERLRAQLPAAATELVSRSHDRYRALIEVALHRFIDNRDLARFLVFELLERPEAVRAWLSAEAAPWLGLVRGVVEQSGVQQPQFDPEAHVAVLGLLMLAQSALALGDRRWRKRVEGAATRMMALGSMLR